MTYIREGMPCVIKHLVISKTSSTPSLVPPASSGEVHCNSFLAQKLFASQLALANDVTIVLHIHIIKQWDAAKVI